MNAVNWPTLPGFILEIAEKLRMLGGKAFVVGGWVRDALLNPETGARDFDIEVYGVNEVQLLAILRQYGRASLVGKSFGVYLLSRGGEQYDFSFPRTEVKTGKGHRGFEVVPDPTLTFRQAALRRDFTINAMGLCIPEMQLLDEYGGLTDLAAGMLRHVSEKFAEDPLRVLRAAQFSARFGFAIAPETIKLCQTLPLHELSAERIAGELRKLLEATQALAKGLLYLQELGVGSIIPQLDSFWSHTQIAGLSLPQRLQLLDLYSKHLQAAERLESLLTLLLFFTPVALRRELAAICVHHLGIQKSALQGVRAIEGLWPTYTQSCNPEFSRGQLARAILQMPLARLNMLFNDLDCVMGNEPKSILMHKAQQLGVAPQAQRPLLSGKLLMENGFTPGKHMGSLILQCFELELDGVITSVPAALQWAQNAALSRGLLPFK
jgi:tRNA nucleotidyltransferase (CCA-adding enzyme)